MKREEELIIIERILGGEAALYNQLVNLHAPKILSVVRGVVSSREDAEEVAQDVFVKAYFSLKSFRGECSFSTWLFRIAFNMSVSKARKRHMEHIPMEKTAAIPDNSHESREEIMDKENRFKLLYKAIDELEPSDRFLILSFYNHEKSIKEICEICGMTESNVKVRLHRIKKKLGVMLGEKMEVCYG
ncbi:MAG: RNA polymerase subunit sigma-70 [Bacteroidetes bacterium HGW-Bacteroidetes-10]|nr:MAG: RNA polymerase subunit sigma-70 [Bacteroidetes bacterium HGW-Bacteroidetes-10]